VLSHEAIRERRENESAIGARNAHCCHPFPSGIDVTTDCESAARPSPRLLHFVPALRRDTSKWKDT
jgi:hypothetical protein